MVGLKEIYTLTHITLDGGIFQTSYGEIKEGTLTSNKTIRLPHLAFNKGMRPHNKCPSQI